MTVSKQEAMTMFDCDLRIIMDNIGGLLRHYQIADWEAYLFFRKPGCADSYVLKYEASAGDDFAKAIVALHVTPTKDSAVVSEAITLHDLALRLGWGQMHPKAILDFAIERELLLRMVQEKLETHKSDAPDARAAILERLSLVQSSRSAGFEDGVRAAIEKVKSNRDAYRREMEKYSIHSHSWQEFNARHVALTEAITTLESLSATTKGSDD